MHKVKENIIFEKQKVLESATKILKEEYIGLDSVIDNIMDSLSSWYLFPQIQEKPVIVNLWGMTGVGKSSLVKRLTELICYENKYFRFDLGQQNDKSWEVRGKLEELFENEDGIPLILGLDEFQHAKSLNEKGEEIKDSPAKIVWDLLDSGKFSISRGYHSIERIYTTHKKLKFMIHSGVTVENGAVVEHAEKFIEYMRMNWRMNSRSDKASYNTKDLFFFDKDYYEDAFIVAPELFKNEFEVREQFEKLNGPETILFLEQILEYAKSPKTIDCSKSLIFIMGNLDEAYWMSGDLNPDINADEFHENSLKINIAHIKNALRARFRNEQIARLGNNHIIYPAFSSQSFMSLIDLELKKYSVKYKETLGLNIEFDEKIKILIFKEGVFPVQGTRPLFTTINQFISSKIGKVFYEKQVNFPKCNKIVFSANESELIIDFYRKGKLLNKLFEKVELNLEKLRKNRKDDLQAIIAVHESGHAVTCIALQGQLPEYVYSVTADADSLGFMYSKNTLRYISKKMIIKRVAMFLGGYAAEKILFGADNVTTGAQDDFRKATRFVFEMLKSCGMGSKVGTVAVEDIMSNFNLHDSDKDLNKEGEKMLAEAMEMATKALETEKVLLLKLSDYLADHTHIRKPELKAMVDCYAVNKLEGDLEQEVNGYCYRKKLKELVSCDSPTAKVRNEKAEFGFSMNMNNPEKRLDA